MTEQDPNQCPEIDQAMNEPCTRVVGHEGPHDALGEPEMDPEPEDVPESLQEQPRPLEDLLLGEDVPSPDQNLGVPLMVANPDLVGRFQMILDSAVKNRVLTGGEYVDYALGSTGMPDANGNIRPFLIVTIFVPSMNIGEKIYASGMVDNFYLESDDVNRLVTDMVNGLVEHRRRQGLSIQQQSNGLKESVEGFISPGQSQPG